jgi:spore maturation protein CgeB
MRFLIVDTYYQDFLKGVYARYPDLAQLPYPAQWQTLMEQCFGTSDFYSENLKRLGHEATEIISNCYPLQMQWAKEHGLKLLYKLQKRMYRGLPLPWLGKDWWMPVLLEQIKLYRPTVVLFQDPGSTPAALLRAIRPYTRLLTAQIASLVPPGADFSQYDLILSSLPHYVQRFRAQGLFSALFRLGFESSLLNRLPSYPHTHTLVHIGGYGSVHRERNKILETLIEQGLPLECWGYGIEHTLTDSSLRRCYRGEAWGLDMYAIRQNSKIVVSRHISSVANVYANIMTLYETTGVATLLVIDQRKDLVDLFEPGKEVIAYRTADECADLIKYYISHEDERQAIARAGQQRTLREHTYYHRMQEFIELIQRIPGANLKLE